MVHVYYLIILGLNVPGGGLKLHIFIDASPRRFLNLCYLLAHFAITLLLYISQRTQVKLFPIFLTALAL